MNILFLLSQPLKKNIGGVERVTDILIREFTAAGSKVGVVFFWKTHFESSDPEICRNSFFTDVESGDFSDSWSRIVEKFSPDIIINQGGRCPISLSKLRFNNDVKIITSYHTMIWSPKIISDTLLRDQSELLPKWKKTVMFLLCYRYYFRQLSNIRNLTKESDLFVTCSNNLVPSFRNLVKNDEQDKIIAVNNPASYQVSDGFLKEKEILSVSRLEYSSKRLDYLLKAWSLLENKYPDWRVTIVGGPINGQDIGQHRELCRLKEICRKYKLNRVHFAGFQEPLPYYQKSAIFAMTSRHESWGMSLIEASSQGAVPVLFNSFPAASEIITDGVNGCLVPPFDVKKYAETLEKLMSDEQLRNQMSLNAQENIRRFAPTTIAKRWMDIFEKVASERK